MLRLLALLLALSASPALAATYYVDTAANGSASAGFSGTTDTTTPRVNGTAATITCSATTYTGSTPGCSLSGTPNLSTVVTTAGATQDAINLACATNSNQKIFKVTAVDDGADLVQTSGTVTGCTAATSDWAIGGRFIWTPASIQAAVVAGDTIILNTSPASTGADFFTATTSGSNTAGYITIRGKVGVRPLITVTAAAQCFEMSSATFWWIENIECDAGSAAAIQGLGQNTVLYNIKISDAGTTGITYSGAYVSIINSEIVGADAAAIIFSGQGPTYITGNYIHNNGTIGISFTAAGLLTADISNNIIANNGTDGVAMPAGTLGVNQIQTFTGNTVYGNGGSGLLVTDAEQSLRMFNNIFVENGNAADEYNVEWTAGTAETATFHAYNVYYHSACAGGAAGSCVFGLTPNATEVTTSPVMTDPVNGNFTISSTSPALGTGFPGQMLGAASTGYLDIGAQQRQMNAAGGGGGFIIGGG